MYIVEYSHGHGTDIWNTNTKDEAVNSIVEAIFDNLDELDDENKLEVLNLIASGDFGKATEKYCECMRGESFDYNRGNHISVISSNDSLVVQAKEFLSKMNSVEDVGG